MSAVTAAQRANLDLVSAWATEISQHLRAIQSAHSDVHFRPGSRGVSMVGLLPERPQRGKSNIRDLPRLARDFDAQFAKHCRDIAHGRPTPEKRLQAHLVSNAYAHDRRMAALERAGDVSFTFVTDEIVIRPLNTDGSGKIVCDILALRRVDDLEVPVVIELKSTRAMTELIRQTETYAALMLEHQSVFERLFAALLGREIRFGAAPEKWVVWPAPGSGGRRDGELRQRGIGVIEYEELDEGYRFQRAAE